MHIKYLIMIHDTPKIIGLILGLFGIIVGINGILIDTLDKKTMYRRNISYESGWLSTYFIFLDLL